MGIIIFPFLLAALVFCIWALIVVAQGFFKKSITFINVLAGLLLSLFIYALLFLDYKLSKSAYALGTYFMFSFFMIIIPFVIGLCFKEAQRKSLMALYYIFLISVIFSGLIIAIFPAYTFGIIDYLGIAKSF